MEGRPDAVKFSKIFTFQLSGRAFERFMGIQMAWGPKNEVEDLKSLECSLKKYLASKELEVSKLVEAVDAAKFDKAKAKQVATQLKVDIDDDSKLHSKIGVASKKLEVTLKAKDKEIERLK
ncbi:unnamed protein product [Ilex paraguariensis]|uniref:Uncharacterized protein n=1 Tax=Ilex paraguariensis TaxID=185542 RepID=A0ABC8SY60_9AQUA